MSVEKSLSLSTNTDLSHLKSIHKIKGQLNEISITLRGDKEIDKYQFETFTSLNSRLETIVWNKYYANVNITNTNKNNFEIIEKLLNSNS
jgi:hypothetical protein